MITYLGQIAHLMKQRGWSADQAWAYLEEVRSRFAPGTTLGIDTRVATTEGYADLASITAGGQR